MEINNEKMMQNLDYSYKINLWLVNRYREDLFKRFNIGTDDLLGTLRMFDAIYEEQCKEMPLPWYQYGFGGKE